MKGWLRATRAWAEAEAAVISIEYAMLGGLIAVVCVLTLAGLGDATKGLLLELCNQVTQAVTGAPSC